MVQGQAGEVGRVEDCGDGDIGEEGREDGEREEGPAVLFDCREEDEGRGLAVGPAVVAWVGYRCGWG